MKELSTAAALLGLVSVVMISTVREPQAQTKAPVMIGAIEVLTGPNSRYGIAIKRGFDLALEQVNKTGVLGGRPIEIAYEDSAGSKEQAINATRSLIGSKHVSLLLGPSLSSEMFAIGPLANQNKVPIIGTSVTAIGITAIGPYVFRTSLPEANVIPVTLRAAQEKFGVRRVAVMYGNDEAFTKSAYEAIKVALEKLGIETVATETFSNKDSDFSAQLTKIKSLDPDAIVVSSYVEAAVGILLAKRSLGFPESVRVIGGNGMISPKLGEIAGVAADGTLVGSPWFIDKNDPKSLEFVKDFKARFNEDPDQFAAQAYDTMFIAAAAIESSGDASSSKIRDALTRTDYVGVMGKFGFTPDRDPAETSGVVVLEMKSGRFHLLP